MPRVLRLINRLNLGGPTFNAALLTRYMAPEFETLLVAGTKQDSEESSSFIIQEHGLNFIELPEMQREISPLQDYHAYRKLRSIIQEFKPDIVHTHAAKAGALGRLAALAENVPVVVHTFHGHVFHSYFNPIKTRFFLGIERYLARRSQSIIAISERQKYELSQVHRVCDSQKITIVPLGFDLSKFRDNQEEKRRAFRQQYLLNEDELAVGIIGRLVPIKNHSLFLHVAARFAGEQGKRLRFFIIGDGESRQEILSESRSLGLDTVFFPEEPRSATMTLTSWRRDVDTVLAGLDIVTLTSWNEGTPVSLIEAQAAGKPIVTTRVGGIENAVLPDQTALLVSPGSGDEFHYALESLVLSEKRRQDMSVAGWAFVQEKYHYIRLVADMKRHYYSLLSNA